MKVVITGGTGMLGRRLALRILAAPELIGPDGTLQNVDRLVLFDAFPPVEPPPDDPRVELVTGDICDRGVVAGLIDTQTDAVIHFAAVVSGGAEADFDLGYAVNLDGGRNVLEAARQTMQDQAELLDSYGAAASSNMEASAELIDGRRPRSFLKRTARTASSFASSGVKLVRLAAIAAATCFRLSSLMVLASME